MVETQQIGLSDGAGPVGVTPVIQTGTWPEGGALDPRNHPASAPAVIVDADAGIVRTDRRKVALVGFASSTRDQAPFDDPSWLIVGLNQLYRYLPRADLWYEVHNRPMFERDVVRDTDYVGWLRRCPLPIFMGDRFDDIPQSVRYPLERMIRTFGIDYFTSTPAFMMAWAIDAGFDEIGVFGIDLVVGEEYEYQKPCMEYWIGVARGRGITVTLPAASALLKQSHRYGYETEPTCGPFVMSRIERRLKRYADRRNALLTEINALEGAMQEADQWRQLLLLHQRGAALPPEE